MKPTIDNIANAETVPGTRKQTRWHWLHAPLFSPKGFIVRAGLIAAIYGALHLLNWRSCTTIICGTTPNGSTADLWGVFRGCAYVFFHFLFVLGVPTLLIAAGLLALFLQYGHLPRDCAQHTI